MRLQLVNLIKALTFNPNNAIRIIIFYFACQISYQACLTHAAYAQENENVAAAVPKRDGRMRYDQNDMVAPI